MGIRDFLREQVNESPAGGSGGADGGLGPAPTPTPAPPPSSGYVPVTVPPAPPRITREEIGKIADDPRTQRQLERLFRQIGANRDNTDQAVNSAEAANASANEALAQLTRIADALTLLATQPAVTPAITPAGDLAPRGPVHGEPVQAALTNTSGRR
jgi:hypothetical protein